jgi:hypothetical protein
MAAEFRSAWWEMLYPLNAKGGVPILPLAPEAHSLSTPQRPTVNTSARMRSWLLRCLGRVEVPKLLGWLFCRQSCPTIDSLLLQQVPG